jgi:ADP-heptose:LPS heptosyltransferase
MHDKRLIPSVRKIAVLRANAIGDFVVTLPALEALRATYPEAEIVLLAREWHADFLRDRPGPIDRVVVAPPARGITQTADGHDDRPALEEFFHRMQQERFDLAIQMHGGGRNSNPFVLQLGARVTVGTRTPDAAALDRSIPYGRWQHEVMRYLEVVSLVGAVPVSVEPRLTVTATDLEEAREVLLDEDRPIVALHPGATDPERWWPADRFAAVGDALAAEGARIVVIGTESEHVQVEMVLDTIRQPALNLCGQLSLRGTFGLLSRCRLIVGNDSGPLHLAGAAGTATVGIYSYFNLMTYGPLTRARHRPAISWRQEPERCEAECEEDGCLSCRSFVTDVRVDDVLTPALDLLRSEIPAYSAPVPFGSSVRHTELIQ